MLIFDGHLDLAWNAITWNRDITASIDAIRRAEETMTELRRGANTVSLPAMRAGKVGICLATALARFNRAGATNLDFRSPEIASASASSHYIYYELLERRGEIRIIYGAEDLKLCAEEWQSPRSSSLSSVGVILAMEGADPILSPDDLEAWYRRGLRSLGLSHYGAGVYAHGTGSSGGLTTKAPALLRAMEQLNIVLDVTHLTDEGILQALEMFQGTVIASHHNCRALVPGQRQLTDDQISALIERKAVIGVALDTWMLSPTGWVRGSHNNPKILLNTVVDHIDHICRLAGNSDHAAIGSDLDGGFGREQSPVDLNSIQDLAKLPAILSRRGYSPADIQKITSGNWLRLFHAAWSR